MRIEAYNSIQQMYQTKPVNRTAPVARTGSFVDNLQISSIGKDIQTAKQAVAKVPDVRSEKTAPIKASIDNGTYNVSTESFADKLIEKYQAGLF